MAYNTSIHHRRSIRLKGYDYSQAGAYFVTIVTQGRAIMFSEIIGGNLYLNDAGRMIEKQWLILPDRFPCIKVDEFVVMPNHFHGIIIVESVGASLVDAQGVETSPTQTGVGTSPTQTGVGTSPTHTLGGIIGAFKSITTNEYIFGVRRDRWSEFSKRLWHRNYYEHIIRSEKEWMRIAAYIQNNPSMWNPDQENLEKDNSH